MWSPGSERPAEAGCWGGVERGSPSPGIGDLGLQLRAYTLRGTRFRRIVFKLSVFNPRGFLAFHSQQSAELRSLDATIPWELRQMRDGEIFRHPRLIMCQLKASKYFSQCGIEAEWDLSSATIGSFTRVYARC